MNAESLTSYARTKQHAKHEYKKEWEADLVTISGKTFLMVGSYKDGRPIATVKCDPARAIELREACSGVVIPGYYSNKRHWNSVFLDSDMDEAVVRGMIDDSYDLVLAGLPKKVREELKT